MPLPALIPRSLLFGIPARHTPSLSPTGRHVGYVAPLDGVRTIWVGPADTDDARPLPQASDSGIIAFDWSYDGRHLIYLQDRDGDENTHVYAADIHTGSVRDLTPYHGVQARLIGVAPGAPHHVLVSLNRRDRLAHDAYRIDLRTGATEPVSRNEGFARWIPDRALAARGALRWTPDGGLSLLVDAGGGDWRAVHTVDADDASSTRAIGFTGDGRALVVLSPAEAETSRVLRVDLTTNTTKVLYEDLGNDVSGVDQNPVTGEADLVVVDRDRAGLEPLTPQAAAGVAELRRRFTGDLAVIGRDAADRTWLVLDYAPDRVATYYRYDRPTGRTRPLFAHRPELAQHILAPVEPFSFAARDGLTVHGYLTFPVGVPRTGLPAVLAVHGGPWGRDRWGSGECQWLANRGYLSAQINFRGSTGYGKSFVNAGDREWGRRMQHDLTDAVAELVRRGIVDRARVGVFGSSYGGYAALAGAAFTPDLYRCAVAVCAPSDLGSFTRACLTSSPMLGPQIRRRIGDPDVDGDMLWSRSPLSRVNDIRIPLLVAHGANDPRVRRAEADQLVAALARNGVPHRYLLFEDEGHSFMKSENRLAFYAAAEAFLADHLGGRNEPA
jgi:dipeptidyl aminopeptidase/acylaminoacyl peptidase